MLVYLESDLGATMPDDTTGVRTAVGVAGNNSGHQASAVQSVVGAHAPEQCDLSTETGWEGKKATQGFSNSIIYSSKKVCKSI